MAWVIPIFLAYIPGLIIWFMIFTLLITRYHELPLEASQGRLARRRMAAGDDRGSGLERRATRSCARSNTSANSHTQVRLEVVVADNNSTDDTALLADAAGDRLPFRYRRVFEAKQGKHHALNAVLETVTTPLVVTVDADTLVHPSR